MDCIVFDPIYKERVWGGRKLRSSLGRSLPIEGPVGESWEIVDRDYNQSVIVQGPFKGQTIREVLLLSAEKIMGPGWEKSRPFPILVKWLDCSERLSLQVHPPKSIASELGGESKTENWYVAEADPEASLIVGLKRGVTRSNFEKALKGQDLENYLHRFQVVAGDSIFVPSGRLHAIDKGNLILEIQENSDTTYRVYDWDRVGLDGKPRQLHVEESLKSINFQDFEPGKVHPENGLLFDNEIFRLSEKVLPKNNKLEYEANEQPRIVSVIEGCVAITSSSTKALFYRGSNVLLPYAGNFDLEGMEESSKILVTDKFNR